MAQLPPDGKWLIQQIGGEVILFHRHTEQEVVRFDPSDGVDASRAQAIIHDSAELSDEQKSYAHFWSGYFYGHSTAA